MRNLKTLGNQSLNEQLPPQLCSQSQKSNAEDVVQGSDFDVNFMIKGNYVQEIQDIENTDEILDFNSVQTAQMTLIERAKLFVHLQYGTKNEKM